MPTSSKSIFINIIIWTSYMKLILGALKHCKIIAILWMLLILKPEKGNGVVLLDDQNYVKLVEQLLKIRQNLKSLIKIFQ